MLVCRMLCRPPGRASRAPFQSSCRSTVLTFTLRKASGPSQVMVFPPKPLCLPDKTLLDSAESKPVRTVHAPAMPQTTTLACLVTSLYHVHQQVWDGSPPPTALPSSCEDSRHSLLENMAASPAAPLPHPSCLNPKLTLTPGHWGSCA